VCIKQPGVLKWHRKIGTLGLVISIHKEVVRRECSNYWATSLISISGKVYVNQSVKIKNNFILNQHLAKLSTWMSPLEGVESNCLHFANDLLLLASFEQVLQNALVWFSAGCDHVGMTCSTNYSYVIKFPQKRKQVRVASERQCTTARQEFEALCDSNHERWRRNKEIYSRFGKAVALYS